jgi:hypothetical protein
MDTDLLRIQISMEAENWDEMCEKVIYYLKDQKNSKIENE